MSFLFSGLSLDPFCPLAGLADVGPDGRRARRLVANTGFVCRADRA
ncbi:hypothetical protein [Allosphingosinicella sp.]